MIFSKRCLIILLSVVWLATCLYVTTCSAQDIEIDGLVINQTRTRMGSDFYRVFSQQWGQPSGFKGYNIVIKETPSVRQGSMYEITVNNRTVVRGRLLPKASDIDESVSQSIRRVQYHLLMQLNKNVDNGDLRGDGY